jgi:hypothetical protein
MKYMLLIYPDAAAWSDSASAEKMHSEYMTFTQDIISSGEFVSGDALQGTETATTVRVRGNASTSTDGPYAETKEHLGGFYVVEVKDLDRALELAARIPDAATGGVEVRPIADVG